jgi:hypothetical protein
VKDPTPANPQSLASTLTPSQARETRGRALGLDDSAHKLCTTSCTCRVHHGKSSDSFGRKPTGGFRDKDLGTLPLPWHRSGGSIPPRPVPEAALFCRELAVRRGVFRTANPIVCSLYGFAPTRRRCEPPIAPPSSAGARKRGGAEDTRSCTPRRGPRVGGSGPPSRQTYA